MIDVRFIINTISYSDRLLADSARRRQEAMRRSKGFGLVELLVVLVVASLLVSVAVPSYDRFVQRARVAAAIGEIGELSLAIEQYRLRNNDRIPMSIAELGIEVPLDPWGRPYEFLNIQDGAPLSDVRKDGKLNPLNTDFDLFSRGRDGEFQGPLSAERSRDDIVRANNGAFIGLGKDY